MTTVSPTTPSTSKDLTLNGDQQGATAAKATSAAPSSPAPAPSSANASSFIPPVKRVVSQAHLERFQKSQAYFAVMGFIEALNQQVVGKKLTDEVEEGEAVKAVLKVLDEVEDIAKATPPVENVASRFGNPAFRTFYEKMKEQTSSLHSRIPNLTPAAIPELETYFSESWGNATRIDYGSGMELNFLCWLFCLQKLGIFRSVDYPALVLRVFWRYVQVMRVLQSTYWLEPAGSHGVWGLDDYHFLPFLFGAAQLKSHKYLRPKSIHDSEIVDEFSKDYMYLACIKFINSIKTASLRWHSPMLDDISGVKTWAKVNEGMIKMYRAEVLDKLPIAQHFFFGSLLPFPDASSPEEEAADRAALAGSIEDAHGHVHAPGAPAYVHGTGEGQAAGWGDCCGIPIPSAFAAAEAEKEKEKLGSKVAGVPGAGVSGAIRRIPFD